MDSVTLAHSDQSGTVLANQTTAQRSGFSKDRAIPSFGGRIPSALFGSAFTFFVNGSVIESDVFEAVGLSFFVREQLSVDSCASFRSAAWRWRSVMAMCARARAFR
jgi:hypothetical protein